MADLKDAGAVAVSDDGRCVTSSARHAPRARVRDAPSICTGHPARRGSRAHRRRADARGRRLDAARPARLAARRRGHHRRARRAARRDDRRSLPRRARLDASARCASCARRSRAGIAVTAEVTPHHLLAHRRSGPRLRHRLQGQPAAARGGRRRSAPRGARRRHHRRHRHRSRAALAAREGLRVRRRVARDDRPRAVLPAAARAGRSQARRRSSALVDALTAGPARVVGLHARHASPKARRAELVARRSRARWYTIARATASLEEHEHAVPRPRGHRRESTLTHGRQVPSSSTRTEDA